MCVHVGKVNFWLWPHYAKALLAFWLVCFLVGLVLLLVGVSSAKQSVWITGIACLALVMVMAFLVLVWVVRVRSRQSYAPNHTHSHPDAGHSKSAESSRSQLSPAASGRVAGPHKPSTDSLTNTIPGEADDSSSAAVLCNMTRRESGVTVTSSDFWRENATLQRLPTANSLQQALENNGSSLLQYEDFQASDDTIGSENVSRITSLSQLESFRFNQAHGRRESCGESNTDAAVKDSAKSSVMSSGASSHRGSTDNITLPKSASTSQVNPGLPARQRPRSNSTSVRSSIDPRTLEVASQQLLEQEHTVNATPDQLMLASSAAQPPLLAQLEQAGNELRQSFEETPESQNDVFHGEH